MKVRDKNGYDDQDASAVRTALAELTETGPPLGFSGQGLLSAGRRRRRIRIRIGTAAVAAAAGVAVAVAVPSVVFDAHPASTPTGSPGTLRTVAYDWDEVARRCARSNGPGSGSLRVYNIYRDAGGVLAMLYGRNIVMGCDLTHWPTAVVAGSASGDLGFEWLPGPVSVDYRAGSSGYPGGRGRDPMPGYDVVGGRVASKVTRVAVSLGADTLTVRSVNKTYLVRFLHPAGQALRPDLRSVRIKGYDAEGRLLADFDTDPDPPGCYRRPDGTIAFRIGPNERCEPALRWP